jgi:uncharacterized lipoprotein YddW (UPF0748 family)
VGVLVLALCAACAFLLPLRAGARQARGEVRALWVLRSSLTTPAAIAAMVRLATTSGFNTLLVQVRGRGDAYFNGGIEPRAAPLDVQPAAFDPLRETLRAARESGLAVHAWVNLNLVSSAVNLPDAPDHVVNRYPEWLMVPRSIAEPMARIDQQSPAYIGRLARFVRAAPQELEGLYVSPIPPAAASYTVSVVKDLLSRYAVDGVHLDYARYPNSEFDYSRGAVVEFTKEVAPSLAADERRELDARAAVDLFAYPDAFPERWAQFRRSRLTSLVMRVRTTIKTVRPEAIVSAAVFAEADEAYTRKLQDWRAWIENDLLDVVCPMAYTPDGEVFARQIAAASQIAGAERTWAGIGAYRLPLSQTVENILTARRLGARGVVLFSYDSLTGPSQPTADYLPRVGRTAFGLDGARPVGSR